MAQVNPLLTELRNRGGSDLHLTAGRPPLLRLHGELTPLRSTPLAEDELVAMIDEIIPDLGAEAWITSGDFDFAYALPGVARFRVNLFRQERGSGAVFRIIPERILTLQELEAPPALQHLAHLRQGLVLVTGPTGSGKSTTMAAIIDAINETYVRHVITIEDPVEFVHPRKKCLFSQREVGQHTRSFANALRAALREDPDVLLVGEMRDQETIGLALAAAEMGVLVFGTLHTNGAAKTIDRVVDAFPEDEQPQVRSSLAETLAGVVSQLLLRTADGNGRVAVHEILLRNPALGNCIREGNTSMLANVIQAGKREGMQTMDDALTGLIQRGRITAAEAHSVATDKRRFEALMREQEASGF